MHACLPVTLVCPTYDLSEAYAVRLQSAKAVAGLIGLMDFGSLNSGEGL
jgi:hypothetical protein